MLVKWRKLQHMSDMTGMWSSVIKDSLLISD